MSEMCVVSASLTVGRYRLVSSSLDLAWRTSLLLSDMVRPT